VISLCSLSHTILVRKQGREEGRKEKGNKEMKERKKEERRANTEVLNK
jgi:hypothetical protein